nr:hypothetical protein [uncultured Rhodopila sp.]
MKTLNWTYRACAPTVNAARVSDQMWLGHRYRNALVEIERWRRQAIADLRTKLLPGLAEAEAAHQAADGACAAHAAEVKARNAQSRSKAASNADRDRTKLLAVARKAAWEAVKAIRGQEKTTEYIAGCSSIQDEFNARWRGARAASGLWAGTYQVVEQAARASFRQSIAPPKFMKFEGHGVVGFNDSDVRDPETSGIPIADVIAGTCTKLRIEPEPLPPGMREAKAKPHTVYLRIGSEVDGRAPVWAVFRARLHRPIPASAIVKWAFLERERVGASYRWQFRLTLACPDGSLKPKPRAAGGVVAVDVGWRIVPAGLRVAYWVGSDGDQGELVIPKSRLRQMRKPEELKSIRDLAFAEVLPAFKAWASGRELPEWMVEATKTLPHWRSQGKLAWLVTQWREKRFDGDGAMYDVLEAWRKQDKHLLNWEGFGRSTDWRKELYRDFAALLRKRYARVIVEDTDWRKIARRAPADSNKHDIEAARWNARVAAVGELCQTLRAFAFAEDAPAEYSTQECHLCSYVNSFDAARSIMQTCAKCGATWDQDENAARVLLARGSVVSETPDPREVVVETEVRRKNTAAEWRTGAQRKRAARRAAAIAAACNGLE